MRLALTLTLGLLLVAPAQGAKHRTDVRKSPDLWATINVCDTGDHPNEIGVRGSMPGDGRHAATLWMRFQVQYLAPKDGKWHNIAVNADSKWRYIGVAKHRVLESGQNFKLLPPPDGGTHTLRGAVTFKWVVHHRIVRKLREFSEGGHRSSEGADPPGYSAAQCVIS